MTSAHTSSLGVVVAVALLAGSASLAAQEGSKEKGECINRREIDVIRGLDDKHAFVKVGASRHYLLTLDKTCVDIKLARQIAISNGMKRVCGDGLTLLTFASPAVGGTMRCRVEKIDRVADMQAALELIESRAKLR